MKLSGVEPAEAITQPLDDVQTVGHDHDASFQTHQVFQQTAGAPESSMADAMSETARRIEALEERLGRVCEVLERTGDDVMALQLLLYAAVRSHPDGETLIAAIEVEREKFMAAALGKSVSEQLIERVNRVAAQAIGLAKPRPGDE